MKIISALCDSALVLFPDIFRYAGFVCFVILCNSEGYKEEKVGVFLKEKSEEG